MRRLLMPLLVVFAVPLAGAGVAAADDPFEPNDSLAAAYGPLNGDELFAAEIATAEDRDFFWFDTTAGGQLTVTLEGGGTCTTAELELLDGGGRRLADAGASELSTPVVLHHTAAGREQYAIGVTANAGCAYTLSLDPPALIAVRPPGVVALLDRTGDPDTVQRVLVDGRLAGEATNDHVAWLDLGVLAPDARITFEAQNGSGSWAWNARITNAHDTLRTLLFQEHEQGLYRPPPPGHPGPVARIGITRRVVITPTGAVLESCGERNAAALCFPLDQDLDGVTDPGDQCPLEVGVASGAGCPDRDGDSLPDRLDACPDAVGPVDVSGCPDADGDRVADRTDRCPAVAGVWPTGCPKLHRYRTVVSVRRRGRRFTGRLLSAGPGCRAGRAVRLRAAGGGGTGGRARTNAAGAFAIAVPRRPRGPFVVSVSEARVDLTTLCRSGTSKPVR